ncbi:MAG: MarR family transcriptional regulator [Syntrophomonadaceae bacterium]|nr:MarR family transcriptional regulator [Syntrophomonadaceae bacterium]MDD3023856.1 MarR family transcriptional regulator [Syntrophomonadaceae bacterium]
MTNHELLIDLLHQVNRKFSEKGKEVISQHDFSISAMILVKQINMEPGISISELARRTNIAKSHISNIIKDLHDRGWVEKRTDAGDHRVLRLFLSPTGTKNVGLVGRHVRHQLAQLLDSIADSRAAQIIEALQDILTALEQSEIKECPHD